MLQQDEPDDYVIATGETHKMREFLDVAFRYAGYDDWEPFVHQDRASDARPRSTSSWVARASRRASVSGGRRT